MTIAYWCVLAVILFPYIFTLIAKWSSHFDNHDPRAYLERTTGWRRRAYAAQLNSFEALPGFVAAVIIAELTHVAQSKIDAIALAFVICRILYGICYLTDKASLRSLCWFAGIAAMIALFAASAMV